MCHINDLIKKFHWKLVCHWQFFFLFKCCITNQCVGNLHLIILSISHVLYLLMIFTNSYWFFHHYGPRLFVGDECINWISRLCTVLHCRLVVKFDYSKLYLWFYFVQLLDFTRYIQQMAFLLMIYLQMINMMISMWRWKHLFMRTFFFCPKTKSCVRSDLF